jgi:starch-binding outer membrane protein, SusD/RagB family
MKKIKNIFLYIIVVSSLLSCEDSYRIDAADEITDLNAVVNMNDLQRAVTGVYSQVGGTSFIEWSAYFTDECRKPLSNRGQGIQVHTWSINNGTNEPEAYYGGLYGTINAVNTILEKIDAVPVADVSEENLKLKYKAELKVIRAMAHFDLLRFFSPSYDNNSSLATTIVDQVIVFETLPRNTVGEVISFVNADLADAYNVLEQFGSNTDKTRITPLAVQALRARISLYTKDYDSAITYSQDVIDEIPLASSPTEYIDIWSDASNAEIIFKLKRVTGNGQVGRIFTDANGDVFYNVSNGLYQNFSSNDVRFYSLTQTTTSGDRRVGKYLGPSSDFGLADIKLFRVAEMYLINAEANALKTSPDLVAAAAAINTLRASRRLSPTALPDLTFASSSAAVSNILLERRMELAFEGHRFFDLKRFNLGIDRLPSDVLLNDFAEDLPAGDYRFTLPIPQQAIFSNNTLIQNPGY